MGSGTSANGSPFNLAKMTCEEVAAGVAAIGPAYECYKEIFQHNGVDGAVVASFQTEVEILQCFEDMGVTKKIHQQALITQWRKLKESSIAAPNPLADDHSVLPATEPMEIHLGDRITKTPRQLMTEMFKIQGIRLDPTDLDPAVQKIIDTVGRSKSDGVNSFDCFINYRVASEADIAEKLYLYLKSNGIKAFLDKKCLQSGKDWKTGFIQGFVKEFSC
jgi:hypothetical protein